MRACYTRYSFVTVVFVLLSVVAVAFDVRQLTLGMAAGTGVKAPLLPDQTYYHGYSQLTLSGYLLFKGAEEGSAALLLKAGLMHDMARYRLAPGGHFGTEHFLLHINPEALLPTKWDKIYISLGFGLQYSLGLGLFETSNAQATGSVQVDLEQAHQAVVHNRRKALPYISLGIALPEYFLQERLSLQLSIWQMALDMYRAPVTIYYYGMGGANQLVIAGYRPTFAGLTASWRMGK